MAKRNENKKNEQKKKKTKKKSMTWDKIKYIFDIFLMKKKSKRKKKKKKNTIDKKKKNLHIGFFLANRSCYLITPFIVLVGGARVAVPVGEISFEDDNRVMAHLFDALTGKTGDKVSIS